MRDLLYSIAIVILLAVIVGGCDKPADACEPTPVAGCCEPCQPMAVVDVCGPCHHRERHVERTHCRRVLFDGRIRRAACELLSPLSLRCRHVSRHRSSCY